MGMDAGSYNWTFPTNGQATDAANAAALTPAANVAFFVASESCSVAEVGVVIGVATAATALIFTVATAAGIGQPYTVVQTITGPAAALGPGTALRSKVCNIRLAKGNVLRFAITGANASGTGQFYAKVYPGGVGTADTVSST